MKTELFVFYDGSHFIRITKSLKLALVDDIDKAAYWTSKKTAKSWEGPIKYKYPKMKMTPAKLSIK